MHLDQRSAIPPRFPCNRAVRCRQLARRGLESGQAGPWRHGAPERRSRPRPAERDALQAVRALSDRAAAPSPASVDAALRPMGVPRVRIGRRTAVVASLLALAVLSYALMILAPQQLAMRMPTAFLLPTPTAGAAAVAAEPAIDVIGAAPAPSR